jgi:hypothetical protein
MRRYNWVFFYLIRENKGADRTESRSGEISTDGTILEGIVEYKDQPW